MEIGTIGKYLAVASIVGVLLTIGCISVPASGDDQTNVDAYPRSPLRIVTPIHYQSVVNGSDAAITTLVLNLTISPDAKDSDIAIQDRVINTTQMGITVADNQHLRFLDREEYHITQWENGDDTLEVGEIAELTIPLQQPIPANTSVYVEVGTPYHGTLALSFRTPDVITSTGQIAEFTAAPFVPR